jgi:hypothetical protein
MAVLSETWTAFLLVKLLVERKETRKAAARVDLKDISKESMTGNWTAVL